jgi:hypothetical protein
MNKKIVSIIALCISANICGQDLNLFQETERDLEKSDTQTRNTRNTTQSTVPVFTLVGTSRFGEKYLASLKHQNGRKIEIKWKDGTVIPIKEFNSFSIVDIGSRSVSIRYPADTPCVNSIDLGITCNGNMAVLRLSNLAPIENNQVENNQAENRIVDIDENESVSKMIRNPFSGEMQEAPILTEEQKAEREERRQRRAEQFRNFEIVRIADDEIPEGMQRIRTPFGDRLEPEEN